MNARRLVPTPSAHTYPLLIKQLLHTPLATALDREIVYRDRFRTTYRGLRERIGRLASALSKLGVQQGETVAVMDWDSHRYLECYFSVPMMGAVLQTVNIRLSPAQIEYTLVDAEASTILVHADFAPLLAELIAKLPQLRRVILLHDDAPPTTPFAVAGSYEALLAAAAPDFEFPELDENSVATTFYTTGTTGLPKGVAFSHRQIVLHTLAAATSLASPAVGQRFHRGAVYMPLTPMFHVHAWGLPYVATLLGVKQVYVGRYTPDMILALRKREGASFSHCVPTILQMLLAQVAKTNERLDGWTAGRLDDDHRRLGDVARPDARGHRARHRCVLRLRHVRDLPDHDAGPARAWQRRREPRAAHPHGQTDRAHRARGGRCADEAAAA